MAFFFKQAAVWHLEGTPRQLPYHLPVQTVGYLPRKRQEVIATDMGEISFNIIFSGGGLIANADGQWQLRAPCLFFPQQIPDAIYKPFGVWEELYILYSREHGEEVFESYQLHRQPAIIQLGNIPGVIRILEDLHKHLASPEQSGRTDRIDSLCESLIRECILSHTLTVDDPDFAQMEEVRLYLEKHYLEDPDIGFLAKQCGMNPTKFRRIWNRFFDLPPKHYVLQQRMDQACQLLTETDLRIGEIATRLNFNDPLYFSKRFKKYTGRSARDYRKQLSNYS